jgi:hypothetical protein
MREEVTLEQLARQLDQILAETRAVHEDLRGIRRDTELVAKQFDAIDLRLDQLHQWIHRVPDGFAAKIGAAFEQSNETVDPRVETGDTQDG